MATYDQFCAKEAETKYYQEMFAKLKPGMSVLALYGTLHQLRRMAIYDQFCAKEAAVLFATDIAARGLDFPGVDWVVQLDCPEDSTTYTHRAGRTARYESAGEALLVLTESEEEGMVRQLEAARIPVEKIEVNPSKQQTIDRKMAAFLASDKGLKESAQRAFNSYIKSVYLMKNKKVFNVKSINLCKFAQIDGFHIKHLLILHQIDALDVAIKSSLSTLLQPLITGQKSCHLPINCLLFRRVDLYFLHRYSSCFQLPNHTFLLTLCEHQESLPSTLIPSSPSCSMCVGGGVFW